MGSKKKDKLARENGGVVAAVTKHGAKFSSTVPVVKDIESPSETPPTPSPESPPSEPAAVPTNIPSIASPLLDPPTTISASPVPSAISEWPRTMNHLGGGSPNLISLMGESPPTQPSSYEDPRGINYGWTPQQRARAQQYATSVSPPESVRRPLSFQADGAFPSYDLRSQASSPPSIRRMSMHSPFGSARLAHHPPPPHQPQAHFYGAPDLDFESASQRGLKAGDRGYHLGFDILTNAANPTKAVGTRVVLAGYEGGLDVYNVTKRGVDPVARLHGLRGAALQAKLLPWTSSSAPPGLFPLVAVVVHGPVIPTATVETSAEPQGTEEAGPDLEGIRTPQSETHQKISVASKAVPAIEAYQTSVEVYSLKTNKLVGVLLELPKIPIKSLLSNPVFRSPSPAGALQIRADEGHVVVSSGETGECWVFRHVQIEQAPGFEFRCIGKVWTSLQQGLKGDSTPDEERSRSPLPNRKLPPSAILALNGRWLAYCPPAPSSQATLNAVVPVPLEGKAPGIASMASPVLPNETSDVDQPISDSMMNRIMRETTQEFIQGAKWVGKQGMQLWNNYWKPGQQPQSRSPAVGSPPWGNSYGSRADAAFPPTYGISGQAPSKDPGLVSLLDLRTLANSTSIHHVTTFKAPLGCSFVSFAPSGLFLFTASTKGDVQTVWDIMRIQHTKSSALQNSQPNNGHATRVRQVAQYSRMTVARIVDVAWSNPNADRIAMVTDRGTVHLLEMPDSAFTWPPPRRRLAAPKADQKGAENASSSAVSMASTALSSAYGVAKPLISGQRRSSTQVQAQTQGNATIMGHASYGGKVLAAGISHSLGNAGTAINHLRHTGENRVSLPLENMLPGLACATWLSGKKYPSLFVVGDGVVRAFTGKSKKPAGAATAARLSQGRRYKDFKLRNIPDDVLAPSIKKTIEPDHEGDIIPLEDHEGGSTLVLPHRDQLSASILGPESSIPQAEIESSAPYQPFHTDRRVGLFELGAEAVRPSTKQTGQEGSKRDKKSQSRSTSPWAFGQSIGSVKLSIRLPVPVDDEPISGSIEDHRALPAYAMERVMQVGENDEQIVVTTRRRRHGTRASADAEDEDDFFEDELEIIDFADQRV